ncbi:hypothetical protein MKW98_020296 [Papaver atlanticum]|uniref:F-box domain-containing protein n=1 Tax=Papaver atlanticum TaxID=357466 RepID=A0AAD4TAZ8_9MAGN|nr:hypothetical protein MKW98_020296 [Papaver atlanticum]
MEILAHMLVAEIVTALHLRTALVTPENVQKALPSPWMPRTTQPFNPLSTSWQDTDTTILLLLNNSISPFVISYVAGSTTSKDLWDTLKEIFGSSSSTHVVQLRTKLQNLKLGNCSELCRGEILTVQAPGTQARSFCCVAYILMDYLPKEVKLDILSRLPVASVLDCKLVCKAWRDILQFRADNFFADLHLQNQHGLQLMQQQEQHEQFLDHDCPNSEPMSFFGLDRHAFYYAEYHAGGEVIDDTQPNYQAKRMNLKFPDAVHGFVGSCNGLICLSVKSKYKTIFGDSNGVGMGFRYNDEPSYVCITGNCKLCVIKGFLCVVAECWDTDLWFLEKNEKTWSWRIAFSTECIPIDNTTGCNILTITKRDEILIGSLWEVILYNLKTRTSRVIADNKWLPHSHFNSFVSLNALGESSVMTFLD